MALSTDDQWTAAAQRSDAVQLATWFAKERVAEDRHGAKWRLAMTTEGVSFKLRGYFESLQQRASRHIRMTLAAA